MSTCAAFSWLPPFWITWPALIPWKTHSSKHLLLCWVSKKWTKQDSYMICWAVWTQVVRPPWEAGYKPRGHFESWGRLKWKGQLGPPPPPYFQIPAGNKSTENQWHNSDTSRKFTVTVLLQHYYFTHTGKLIWNFNGLFCHSMTADESLSCIISCVMNAECHILKIICLDPITYGYSAPTAPHIGLFSHSLIIVEHLCWGIEL